MGSYNPWRVWLVAYGSSDRVRSEMCSLNYEAITNMAAELHPTVYLWKGGCKMAALGSSSSTPWSEEWITSLTLFRGIFRFASASYAIINISAHSMAVPIARSVGWYLNSRHARNQEMWCWKWWSIPYLKQLSTLDYKQSNLQVQYPADMSKGTRGFLKFIPRDWYSRSPSPDLTIL